jgi:hypothetical protein
MRHDDQGKRGRPERVHNGPLGDLYHILLTSTFSYSEVNNRSIFSVRTNVILLTPHF